MEGLNPELETKIRTPEEQALIDRTVDVIAEHSISKEVRGQNMVKGLREAALLVASDIDGTAYGFSRLATFYGDYGALDNFFSFEYLDFAAQIAENFPVEPEVAERLLAQCIQCDRPNHAQKLALEALGRTLTEEEILALVTKRAKDSAIKSSGEKERYLTLAKEHGASDDVLRIIDELFQQKELAWANSYDY